MPISVLVFFLPVFHSSPIPYLLSFKSFHSFFVASVSLLKTSVFPFIPRMFAHSSCAMAIVEFLILIFG